MANPKVIFDFFDKLKEVLTNMDILDKPTRIFKVDESGLNLELRKGKVVVPRGAKHSYSQAKGGRDHITVQCCISASGQVIPPMLIYEKSFPSGNYVEKGPEGAIYAKSANGYIDEELFLVWLTKLFAPHTKHLGKCLLIIDGHGSHLTWDVIDKARELNVELCCLPSHTTHVIQPLDVACYAPLKSHFSRITDKIQVLRLGATTNVTVCKTEFSAVFKLAFDETFTPMKCKSAFAACGIYPFNPYAIDMKRLMPSNATPVSSTQLDSSAADIPTPVVLPRQGVVPQHLIDLFVTAIVSTKKKEKSRRVTQSRWITSDNYRNTLANKIAEDEKLTEEKEARKRLREEKKALKEVEQLKKKQKKEITYTSAKSSDDDTDDVDDDIELNQLLQKTCEISRFCRIRF